MKGKHLEIEADSALLAELIQGVQGELVKNKRSIRTKQWLKFAFYAGFSVVLYALLYANTSPIIFVLTYTSFGMILLLFAFNFAHDFSHNTVFENKRWNSLGFIFIYTLVGAHAEAWRERHVNSHHFAPNVKEYDTDLQITNLIRVSHDMPFKWYHRFQYLYAPIAYSTYSLYWIFIKDITLLWNKLKNKDASPGYLLSFFAQKLFYVTYLLVLPLLYSGQVISVVLIGFLLMHLVQSIFLLFTFFMTHHVLETTYPETDTDGIIQSSWLMNQISSSNDMHPFSETANFFLGGFNNHIAHHLFPNIHHVYYPKMNRVIYRILKEHTIIPNQTSYIGGAISHLRLLKKLSSI